MDTTDGEVGGRKLRADAERNRQRIIASARELFAERGLEVTLDDVAAHAGVGVGTVYRRFANRDELIVGVLAQHLAEVAERARETLDESDPWQAVVDILTLVVSSMAADRGLATMIMTIDHSHPDILAAKAVLTERLQQVLARAHAAGVIRPDLEANDFFPILTMLRTVAESLAPTAPGTWRRYLGLILDGIRADGRDPLWGAPLTDAQIVQIQKGASRDR